LSYVEMSAQILIVQVEGVVTMGPGELNNVDKIRVCVRKRPRTPREVKRHEADIVKIRGQQTVVVDELKVAVDLTKFIQQVSALFDQYRYSCVFFFAICGYNSLWRSSIFRSTSSLN